MADTTNSPARTPWHLWTIGAVALLWNSVGALDFAMTQLKSEAYLAAFTPEQREFLYKFPLWSVIGWGVGTWGGLIGSLLVLLRRSLAVTLFGASLAGIVVTNLYSYVLSDLMKVMNSGAGAMVFSAVIFVIGLLLFLYARAMAKLEVLR
ncbi:MAG: hypothetical protein QG602_3925 [Verrucomicrobiota bacterium]|nr:hypothetical protein [Verrucomicrobiota bacterium]